MRAPGFFSGPSYISGPSDGIDHAQASWNQGARQLDHHRSFFFPSPVYLHDCFNHLLDEGGIPALGLWELPNTQFLTLDR